MFPVPPASNCHFHHNLSIYYKFILDNPFLALYLSLRISYGNRSFFMKSHYQQVRVIIVWTGGALICRIERILPDGETIV